MTINNPEEKYIDEILDYLPHRYPFLLIDRVTHLVSGESIKGYKNVTMNEDMFNGHFPNQPIKLQIPPSAIFLGMFLELQTEKSLNQS